MTNIIASYIICEAASADLARSRSCIVGYTVLLISSGIFLFSDERKIFFVLYSIIYCITFSGVNELALYKKIHDGN